MRIASCRIACIFLCWLGISAGAARAGEWSGYIAGEARLFTESALDEDQHGANLSVSFQPEYHHEWDDNRQGMAFVPFLRLDQHDAERSHADIRELNWYFAARDWELRAGIRKVFWGVTESQHLVDIINQTDLVENPDGEDKLGQPMLNLAWITDAGTIDLFMLTGFRERTFPGRDGRLRFGVPVDTDHPVYESSREERHIDFALRWFDSIGDWDIGLSHFSGTGREPAFNPALDGRGRPVLRSYYSLIEQTGLDVQATQGSWLWKLEAITRSGQGDRYAAATGGFEYTFVGVADSAIDIGVLTEYLFDDRNESAPSPFQNDLFVGTRITLNDMQSTEFLAGVIADLDYGTRLFNLEASRRFGDSWVLSLEARLYTQVAPGDPLAAFRRDDYLQVELARHY